MDADEYYMIDTPDGKVDLRELSHWEYMALLEKLPLVPPREGLRQEESDRAGAETVREMAAAASRPKVARGTGFNALLDSLIRFELF
jgi:hypothetical protein